MDGWMRRRWMTKAMQPKSHPESNRTSLRVFLLMFPLVSLCVLLLIGPLSASAQDADLDGIPDVSDNCTLVANADQHDDDQDLYGDVCDPDLNNDGIADVLDVLEFKSLMGTGDREPDLNGDGGVDYLDLGRLNSMLGQAPGPRGVTAADLDPPVLQENGQLVPVVQEIDGIGNLPPRNVGRIRSLAHPETAFDVVENEVALITDDPNQAAALAGRWSGSILSSVDPAKDLGIAGPSLYLIQVDPSSANLSKLGTRIAAMDPRIHGGIEVSSTALLQLLAVVAEESLSNGLRVSLNTLVGRHAFSERTTTESATTGPGESPPDGSVYSANAFDWSYMEVDPDFPGDSLYPVDTRIAESWRVLEAAGRLTTPTRAMIWDGGFYPNADFPSFTPIGPMRTPNPDPTGCGSSGAPTTACLAHGTHIVSSGWGRPDNAFGTAGPGGALSNINLTLLQSPAIDVVEIVRFILSSIPSALALRPQVLNISAGFKIDAGWCIFACGPLDFLTSTITRSGTLIVASAGNDSVNVDATDTFCFLGCITFESAAYVPCELDNVLCVGATTYGQSIRAGFSNWGSQDDANSVDLWAPGEVWSVTALAAEDANPAPNDALQIISGTSYSAPLTSGVASLVNAARPSLNPHGVRDCLVSTAHTGGFMPSIVRRRVNALDAVRCALGGRSHPFVQITAPADGASFQEVMQAVTVSAAADDAEDGTALSIDWSSNLEGPLGSSTPGSALNLGSLTLRRGTHNIMASVTDSSYLTTTDAINVTITNPLPIMTIFDPGVGERFYSGQTIELFATSQDPNETPAFGPLSEAQVRWDIDGIFIGSGHSGSLPAASLALGAHSLCVEGTDDDGDTGLACITIHIDPVPLNLEPVINITQPAMNTTFDNPPGSVQVPLEWTAIDTEEGVIPFSQLEFFLITNGGPRQPLTVNTVFLCLDPPFCTVIQTLRSVNLEAAPGATTTTHEIIIEGTDTGVPTGIPATGDDSTIVIILKFI